jgi:hypothetical protein
MGDQAVPSLERCQVNVGAGLPLAATVKLTDWPAVTVASRGWVVIAAPGPTDDTVKVALLDLTEPAEFETVTENVAPLSEAVRVWVVYVVLVAPLMSELFLRH